jgi:hypothetical protein
LIGYLVDWLLGQGVLQKIKNGHTASVYIANRKDTFKKMNIKIACHIFFKKIFFYFLKTKIVPLRAENKKEVIKIFLQLCGFDGNGDFYYKNYFFTVGSRQFAVTNGFDYVFLLKKS